MKKNECPCCGGEMELPLEARRLEPLGEKIVIRPDEKADTHPVQMPDGSVKRIMLPKQSQKETFKGTVVAVGDKVRDLKVGDRICYARWRGDPYDWDGPEAQDGQTVIMLEKDVLARLVP